MESSTSIIENLKTDSFSYEILPTLLEKQALHHPDQEAYVFCHPTGHQPEREAITFGALHTVSTNLAAHFLGLGIKKDDCVAVIALGSPEWIYTENALMKIGALMLRIKIEMTNRNLLDDLFHENHVKTIIYHPDVVISSFADHISKNCHEVKNAISMTDLVDVMQASHISEETEQKVETVQGTINSEHAAFVYFTSGSTGIPKGVVFTHFTLVNAYYEFPGIDIREKGISHILTDCPPAWTGSCTILSLVTGVTMVYIDAKHTVTDINTEFVFNVFKKEKINGTVIAPYILNDILRAVEGRHFKWPEALKWTAVTGDICPEALFNRALKYIPHISNWYGLTECDVILYTDKTDEASTRAKYTGKASVNANIKITNDEGEVLVTGEVGELWVLSPFVFKEYLNNPEATAKVKNPVTGWLRTGDLAKMSIGGHVLILQRMSHSIKRAAGLIYPAQVENEILACKEVSKVAVIGVPDERLHEELCAFVIPVQGSMLTAERLKEFCEANMRSSDGMGFIPKYFIIMDSFPLVNGKTDRKKLLLLAKEQLNLSDEYTI